MKDGFQFSVFSVQCLMQQGRGETNSSLHINAPKWHRRPAFAPNGVILDSDHMCENEWELHKRLTKQWIVNGTNIGNLKLMLIASEVMESWEINAPEKHWNKPSIDFLFIDNLGNLWCIELKREINTPLDAWQALCQVTHRAIVLKKTFSYKNLESVYEIQYFEKYRNIFEDNKISFEKKLLYFFGERITINNIGKNPFFRVIAAKTFNPIWQDVKNTFALWDIALLKKYIKGTYTISKRSREFCRFLEIQPADFSMFAESLPMELIIDPKICKLMP